VYVLVVRLKHRYQLTQDANEILQILSVTTLEKTPVSEPFSDTRRRPADGEDANQLKLFD